MKKNIKIFSIIFIFLIILSACSENRTNTNKEKINIVCTMFPQYDWVREITKGAENDVNIYLIADTGADIHSYQPTAEDIIKINNCDLIIYTGGESESWVSDAIQNSGSAKAVDMLKFTDSEHHNTHTHSNGTTDEHIWLSLETAEEICEEIADILEITDQKNADLYEKNAERYCESLERLDEEYEYTVQNSKFNALIFADRFPFRHMTDAYGIEVFSAFPGCSAESESSFDTVTSLSQKLSELKLPAVMTSDNSDQKLAKTIIENSGIADTKILSLTSMQAMTAKEAEENSYISIMRNNLETLKQALN